MFGTMIKVENKDLFVDLKRNSSGVYLKLSERNGKSRSTVLIPASGITRLKAVLEEVSLISSKYVKISAERKNRMAENPDVVSRSVYVSGLAWSTTNEGFAAHFAQVGTVNSATVLCKTRAGKSLSLGCGVVEYSSSEEAAQAVNTMTGTELDGRTLKCREDRVVEDSGAEDGYVSTAGTSKPSASSSTRTAATTRPARAPIDTADRVLEPNKIFVTSLPWETNAADLTSIFSAVGEVVSAEVLSTKKGRSLGHAIVEFAAPQSALEAIARVNGQELQGRNMVVREYFLN